MNTPHHKLKASSGKRAINVIKQNSKGTVVLRKQGSD